MPQSPKPLLFAWSLKRESGTFFEALTNMGFGTEGLRLRLEVVEENGEVRFADRSDEELEPARESFENLNEAQFEVEKRYQEMLRT